MSLLAHRTLAECGVEMAGGQIMSRITVPDDQTPVVETRRVIVPKSIRGDGFLDGKLLPEEKLKVAASPKYLTKAGDIVMKLSTPYDAAVVEETEAGCVVPSFCAIIRSPGELDAGYLLAFLNSSACKDQLKDMVAGAVMAMLSVGKIRSLVVPVPAMECQQAVGRQFRDNQGRLRIVSEISELETLKNDITFRELERMHDQN